MNFRLLIFVAFVFIISPSVWGQSISPDQVMAKAQSKFILWDTYRSTVKLTVQYSSRKFYGEARVLCGGDTKYYIEAKLDQNSNETRTRTWLSDSEMILQQQRRRKKKLTSNRWERYTIGESILSYRSPLPDYVQKELKERVLFIPGLLLATLHSEFKFSVTATTSSHIVLEGSRTSRSRHSPPFRTVKIQFHKSSGVLHKITFDKRATLEYTFRDTGKKIPDHHFTTTVPKPQKVKRKYLGPPSLPHENQAISALRTLVTSQQQFRILKKKIVKGVPVYATLAELLKESMISRKLGSGTLGQYRFKVHLSDDKTSFHIIAKPLRPQTKGRKFYSDKTGVITCTADGSTPTAQSPRIP